MSKFVQQVIENATSEVDDWVAACSEHTRTLRQAEQVSVQSAAMHKLLENMLLALEDKNEDLLQEIEAL